MQSRRLIILGSTGSIGTRTIEVVTHLRDSKVMHYDVVGLATGTSTEQICQQANSLGVKSIAIAAPGDDSSLSASGITVMRGADAAEELIDSVAQRGDLVVAAMVGSAGIPAVIRAIERGCDIALANKETLVAAGAIVMPLARQNHVRVLPVDSEHSAIFQCLESIGVSQSADGMPSVLRIVLTASGGPFRTWPAERIAQATVEEALRHPTWSMGSKVTIDSASLMNKALEIIEAHWLFSLTADRIDAIMHPQSIVHGLVEMVDGSTFAHLSPPDMRVPIQYALTWPSRKATPSSRIDWTTLRSLEFEPIDSTRFPAPDLAKRTIERGGNAGAVLNAANEEAVQAFVNRHIEFGQIINLVRDACEAITHRPVRTMTDIVEADREARQHVRDRVARHGSRCSIMVS